MTLSMHKAKARKPDWTPEEDAIIRDSVRSGQNADAAARRLTDRTAKAVHNRAVRLGLEISRRVLPLRHTVPVGMDAEIIRLCRYMKNDGDVAHYLGTSVERVAALRRRTPPVRFGDGHGARGRPRAIDTQPPIGLEGEPARRSAAERCSASLRSAMLRHYRALARREGTTPEQAMITCLYGRTAAARFTKEGPANG